MKYAAFISYRHIERDSFIAENLQHELEHYHIPSKIQKTSGKKKVGRVFRDREELPISNNLEDNIQSALKESEYLIVICSPESKQSEWVQREVNTFISMHDKKHVLAVLAKAEPADSFPEILCYDEVTASDASGNQTTVRKNIEPLAAEMRGETHKDILRGMKVEKLRLLAPILNCSFDDLKQREKEYRTKRTMEIMGGALIIAAAFSVYAVRQNQLLKKQYRDKQINESKYLANVSENLQDSGDRIKALEVAQEALPEDAGNPDRPVVGEAVYALNNSLYSYNCDTHVNYVPDRTFEMDLGASDFWSGRITLSPSGNYMGAMDVDHNLYIYDLKDKKKTGCLQIENIDPSLKQKSTKQGIYSYRFISDKEVVLNCCEELVGYDYIGNKVLWKTPVSDEYQQNTGIMAAASADGKQAAFFDGGNLILLNASDGKITDTQCLYTGEDVLFNKEICTSLSFSPSGKKLLYSAKRYTTQADEKAGTPPIGVVDTATGAVTVPQIKEEDVQAAVFADENTVDYISYAVDGRMDALSINQPYTISQIDAATGETRWSVPEDKANINDNTRCGIMQCKISGKDTVCAFISNKDFILDPATGEIKESGIASAEIEGMSCYDDRLLYLGTKDGGIYMDSLNLNGNLYEMGSIDYNKVSCFAYSASNDLTLQMKGDTNQIVISAPGFDKNYEKLCDFDASSSGYDCSYRYALHTKGEDSSEPAELWLWKVGADKAAADIKLSGSECFNDFTVCENGNSDMLYYITGSDSISLDTLHAYSLTGSKEVSKLDISAGSGISKWGNADWTSNAGKLLLYDASGFEIIDLKTMKVQETVKSSNSEDSSADTYKADSKAETIVQAILSNDGTEAVLFTESSDGKNICRVKVWDIAAKTLRKAENAGDWDISLAAGAASPKYDVGYDKDTLLFYNNGALYLADLKKMTITDKIPFKAYTYCRFAFIGGDDRILMWGDDKHLKMWSVPEKKMVMEDSDTYKSIVSIMTDRSTEYFGVVENVFAVNMAEREATHIYSLSKDGTFCKYADLGAESVSFDNKEVLSCAQKKMIYYPFYSTQDLIDRAKKTVGDEKLSDTDRQKYFIGE